MNIERGSDDDALDEQGFAEGQPEPELQQQANPRLGSEDQAAPELAALDRAVDRKTKVARIYQMQKPNIEPAVQPKAKGKGFKISSVVSKPLPRTDATRKPFPQAAAQDRLDQGLYKPALPAAFLKNTTQPLMRKYAKLGERTASLNRPAPGPDQASTTATTILSSETQPPIHSKLTASNSLSSTQVTSTRSAAHKPLEQGRQPRQAPKADVTHSESTSNRPKQPLPPRAQRLQATDQNQELESQAKQILNAVRAQTEQNFESLMKKYLAVQAPNKTGVLMIHSGDAHIVRAATR